MLTALLIQIRCYCFFYMCVGSYRNVLVVFYTHVKLGKIKSHHKIKHFSLRFIAILSKESFQHIQSVYYNTFSLFRIHGSYIKIIALFFQIIQETVTQLNKQDLNYNVTLYIDQYSILIYSMYFNMFPMKDGKYGNHSNTDMVTVWFQTVNLDRLPPLSYICNLLQT